jgi:hypothetical protein
LKATLQETDGTTPESDIAPASQGDFEAAMALMGSLTTPMCAVSLPPDAPGLSRPPAPAGEQPSLSDAAQPGAASGDQRIMPIVGEIAPTGPPSVVLPIGDQIISPAPPSSALPPSPPPLAPPSPIAQPSPIGDARIPTTPVPAPPAIAPPMLADAAVQPTDLTQANDEPIDTADVGAGNSSSSSSSSIGDHQPELIAASAAAANSAGESQEAVRSTTEPIIDVATRRDRSRPLDLTGDADALTPGAGTTTGNEAIAVIGSGTAVRATNDTVVKVARSLAQLPAVLSDLAQQARTESSPRRVVIPLDPPALGHVTVEIIVRADSVKVSLQHGDQATFNALNAQRPAIEAALEANGLHLSGFDVSGNQRQRTSHTRVAARLFEAAIEQVEPDGALRL